MSDSRFDYSTFTFNPADPLERSAGESKRANQALRDYAYMGAARSLPQLCARYKAATGPQPTKSLQTLKTWSDRLRWQDRVDLFDESERRREEETWRERRNEIRRLDFEHGSQLRDLFERIIAEAPNYLRTRRRTQRGTPRIVDQNGKIIQEGEPDREVVTVALDVNFALRAEKLATEMQRLAAEMETERTVTETNQTPGLPPVDVDDMDETRYRDALLNIKRTSAALLRSFDVGRNEAKQPLADQGGLSEEGNNP